MGNLGSKGEGGNLDDFERDSTDLSKTSAAPAAGPFFQPQNDKAVDIHAITLDVERDSAGAEVMQIENTQTGDEIVPTVFTWSHGGRQVYIVGTFNAWQEQIPMHRSGHDFTYIHNLPKGKHVYKFIVDDEWRFAPDQPTIADVEGNINNLIDVSEFKPYTVWDSDPKEDILTLRKEKSTGELYGRFVPDVDDYTKEPPPLPPHLRHIILNKPPSEVDTSLLPVPQHVALNHLYCTAIKDGMMVLGSTQRYRRKYVTTVYYSPIQR